MVVVYYPFERVKSWKRGWKLQVDWTRRGKVDGKGGMHGGWMKFSPAIVLFGDFIEISRGVSRCWLSLAISGERLSIHNTTLEHKIGVQTKIINIFNNNCLSFVNSEWGVIQEATQQQQTKPKPNKSLSQGHSKKQANSSSTKQLPLAAALPTNLRPPSRRHHYAIATGAASRIAALALDRLLRGDNPPRKLVPSFIVSFYSSSNIETRDRDGEWKIMDKGASCLVVIACNNCIGWGRELVLPSRLHHDRIGNSYAHPNLTASSSFSWAERW